MSFGFDDYGSGDEYGGNENDEDGGASPGIESDDDEEYGEEVDLGPPIIVMDDNDEAILGRRAEAVEDFLTCYNW